MPKTLASCQEVQHQRGWLAGQLAASLPERRWGLRTVMLEQAGSATAQKGLVPDPRGSLEAQAWLDAGDEEHREGALRELLCQQRNAEYGVARTRPTAVCKPRLFKKGEQRHRVLNKLRRKPPRSQSVFKANQAWLWPPHHVRDDVLADLDSDSFHHSSKRLRTRYREGIGRRQLPHFRRQVNSPAIRNFSRVFRADGEDGHYHSQEDATMRLSRGSDTSSEDGAHPTLPLPFSVCDDGRVVFENMLHGQPRWVLTASRAYPVRYIQYDADELIVHIPLLPRDNGSPVSPSSSCRDFSVETDDTRGSMENLHDVDGWSQDSDHSSGMSEPAGRGYTNEAPETGADHGETPPVELPAATVPSLRFVVRQARQFLLRCPASVDVEAAIRALESSLATAVQSSTASSDGPSFEHVDDADDLHQHQEEYVTQHSNRHAYHSPAGRDRVRWVRDASVLPHPSSPSTSSSSSSSDEEEAENAGAPLETLQCDLQYPRLRRSVAFRIPELPDIAEEIDWTGITAMPTAATGEGTSSNDSGRDYHDTTDTQPQEVSPIEPPTPSQPQHDIESVQRWLADPEPLSRPDVAELPAWVDVSAGVGTAAPMGGPRAWPGWSFRDRVAVLSGRIRVPSRRRGSGRRPLPRKLHWRAPGESKLCIVQVA